MLILIIMIIFFFFIKQDGLESHLNDAVVLVVLLSNMTHVFSLFVPPQQWFTHSLLSSCFSPPHLLRDLCDAPVEEQVDGSRVRVTRSPAADRCRGFVIRLFTVREMLLPDGEGERWQERERDRWHGGGWRVRGWVTAVGWLTMTHILVVTSPGDSPSHHSDFALFWGRIAPVLHQMQLSIRATRGSSRPPWTGQCSSLGWPLKPFSGKNTP